MYFFISLTRTRRSSMGHFSYPANFDNTGIHWGFCTQSTSSLFDPNTISKIRTMATTTTVQEHIMAAPVPMTTTKHLGLGMPRVESSTFSLSQLLNAHNSDDDAATSKAPQAKPQLYRLVRVEDDGDTARLATPADVDDMLAMLGPDVDPRSISPIPTPKPVVPPQTPSTRRVPLAGAYKVRKRRVPCLFLLPFWGRVAAPPDSARSLSGGRFFRSWTFRADQWRGKPRTASMAHSTPPSNQNPCFAPGFFDFFLTSPETSIH